MLYELFAVWYKGNTNNFAEYRDGIYNNLYQE